MSECAKHSMGHHEEHNTCGRLSDGAVEHLTRRNGREGGKDSRAKQMMPTVSATGVQGRESWRWWGEDQGRLQGKERTQQGLEVQRGFETGFRWAKKEKGVSSNHKPA